jgi:hypothetical protein
MPISQPGDSFKLNALELMSGSMSGTYRANGMPRSLETPRRSELDLKLDRHAPKRFAPLWCRVLFLHGESLGKKFPCIRNFVFDLVALKCRDLNGILLLVHRQQPTLLPSGTASIRL